MNEELLKQLLRQRRNPEAPQGYYEDLLRNLHDQQRSEMLHRPLWRIVMDRLSTFWGEHSFSAPAYSTALAAVTITSVWAILTFGSSSSTMGPSSVPMASRSGNGTRVEVLPAAVTRESTRLLPPDSPDQRDTRLKQQERVDQLPRSSKE